MVAICFCELMGLRIIHQGGSTYDLAGEVVVGRDAGCTIALVGDAGASRRHARFIWLHGLPMIEDLGSSNGTFLNGARVTQARPVSSGDEVLIGAASLRIEAVMDGVANPPPAPVAGGKEISRGEGRGKGNRKTESSGAAEGSLYGNHGGGDSLRGCAMPNVDLSGCMKYLWILLLVLLAAVVIGLILFGIGALLTAVSGGGSAVSGAAGGSGGSSSPGDNQPAPPPVNSPPPQQQPPPQDQNQQQQAPSAEGIHIEEVKVDFARRGGTEAKPVVLIKWMNLTKKTVERLSGTVYLYDKAGKLIVEIPREQLYSGSLVNPGEGHQDTLEEGGVVILRELGEPPVSAKVKVERIE